MSLVYQLTSQIAAGTVDELRFAARGRAEVVDAGFVMNVAEGVDLWLDALLDVFAVSVRDEPEFHVVLFRRGKNLLPSTGQD